LTSWPTPRAPDSHHEQRIAFRQQTDQILVEEASIVPLGYVR
jgi:hypothetical protein